MQATPSTGEDDVPAQDLGPLAWVLDELKKSLDGASKAIRRFVRDAELARGSELESLDASQLRIARQQLHQSVGALEMVGLAEPAKVLRAMESLAQKFVQKPEICSEDSATKVERATFALTQYLESVLRGKSVSAVALFPQYRDVMELIGEERIHPADLWPFEWRWIESTLPGTWTPQNYNPAIRAKMDQAVLQMVKSGHGPSALMLRDISASFAAHQKSIHPRVFWQICAAFFESMAHGLMPGNVYTKRAASRVLMQYTSLARGDDSVSDRLAQDLLFFCAQITPQDADALPTLRAVRLAYGLDHVSPVDYDKVQFGRFDPAALIQARKRIATATETWSALSGGDTNRLKWVSDQFSLVSDSIIKLHPDNSALAHALVKAVDVTVGSSAPPTTPLAMEVATAILYLDATYEDMDPSDDQISQRSAILASRLERASLGGESEPLETWMEDLYRRVSDRQTMGSVVDELRSALGEVERALDEFFRNPKDKLPLNPVPGQLAQMRGVFSVLGLDQAALATLRMRDSVENFLVDNLEESAARPVIFEKIGNSLGALGFLIDMLSYQRALAKKIFVYDEELGEFKPTMGRVKTETTEPYFPSVALQPEPSEPVDEPASQSYEVSQEPDEDDAELRDIFLEEAREVVLNGLVAARSLAADPSDLGCQTTLRRSFHTLKGSSRMVSLNEYGEAAWAMEQLLNDWLADQKPASDELVHLCLQALQGFGRWAQSIDEGEDANWSSVPFRTASDSLRIHHKLLPLEIPGATHPQSDIEPVTEPTEVVPEVQDHQEFSTHRDFESTQLISGLSDPEELDQPDFQSTKLIDTPADFEAPDQPDFAATQMVDFEATQAFDSSSLVGKPEVSPGNEPKELSQLGELNEIDFSSLLAVSSQDPPLDASLISVDPTLEEPDSVLLPESVQEVDPQSPQEEEPSSAASSSSEDILAGLEFPELAEEDPSTEEASPSALQPLEEEEQVKVIGDLRISIPLYNVFLNEADEWSRRLQTELSEWSLELHRPLPDSTVSLAHSLGGSSATVGFVGLSDVSRSLERALEHVQLHSKGLPEHAQIFVLAADAVRHLLHQFAAGFLKEPDPELLAVLQKIVETEFQTTGALESEQGEELQKEVEALKGEDPRLEDVEETPLLSEGDVEEEFVPAGLQGAARIVLSDDDHDIDVKDHIDEDLFPIFEEEAKDLLPLLGAALRQWSARPDNLSARQESLRLLHTIKGSARLSGAMRMGEMAHRMETAIEQTGSEFVQVAQIEPLLTRFDKLQGAFDDLCSLQQKTPEVVEPLVEPDKPRAHNSRASDRAIDVAEPMAPRQITGQSVRVRAQLLDRLLNQAGEVMIVRSRLDSRVVQLRGSLTELGTNLERLRTQLRDIEVQAESQMQSRLAQTKDIAQGFDPLEFDRFTRTQELTRMMAESVNDVATVQRNLQRTIEGAEDDLIAQGRQAKELQRDLLRTRMVEFESIAERLYGVVRQAAKEADKQVKLDITGGALELDRSVLDRMAPAFEHMIRNAIAHGIEPSDKRVAIGKPAAGQISVEVLQDGNDVSVTFKDDGAGLNIPRIRERAVASDLLEEGQDLSAADAANLIFLPGFSTASQVSEMAGRGIGMDVVRNEVNALGGRIETTTEEGVGTHFKLVVPLTTAVTQVVMLRIGSLSIGVPANLVETVRRISTQELELAYQQKAFRYADEDLPMYWAGALLQQPSLGHLTPERTHPVVIFRSAGQRMAAHVDEVLGNQEVVIKNLGPQLSRLPGLAGMSVLASGAVVLIYNPLALSALYGAKALEQQSSRQALEDTNTPSLPEGRNPFDVPTQIPLVLVVDDSITVRRVTQRLLRREGYRVAMASDGLQALERLSEEKPALVLSDIEMPKMDGFDLVRNIRADAALQDLPIIMITSRIAEKHRELAKSLGVDHYLGKPYSEDELMGLVRQYCHFLTTA